MKKNFIIIITGFLMALADSVPGVSGGTICYITGCYEDFINSINTLLTVKGNHGKSSAILFLTKLGSGWIVGLISAVLVIASLINTHIYELSSLFLGFICFSIPYIIYEERSFFAKKKWHIAFTIIGVLIVVAISKFASANLNIWSNDLTFITYIYIFLAGIVAISSMLLPGISGSTILLIFGLYVPIIESVKSVIKFDFTRLNIVIVFAVGIIIGLKFTSSIISKTFNKFRSAIVHLIIGLMIGSIYAIIVGPTSLTNEETGVNLNLDALSIKTFSIPIFIIGILLILSLDIFKKRLK